MKVRSCAACGKMIKMLLLNGGLQSIMNVMENPWHILTVITLSYAELMKKGYSLKQRWRLRRIFSDIKIGRVFTMDKINTAKSTLNTIKSLCAERDRKERARLESSRLERLRREETEKERIQNTNSILNSYIEKAKERESQHLQEHNQMVQNMQGESMRRRSEDVNRSHEITVAMNKGIQKVRENENRNTADAFMDRNRRLMIKGIEAIKRERNKTYFS